MPLSPDHVRARTSRWLPALVTLLTAAVVAGCAGAPAEGGAPAPSAPAPSETADAAPVTVDNCGFDVVVEAPPQRILAVKSSTLEMLLALGLADRVIGAAFLDGPVPPRYEQEAADVEIVSDRAPGPEAVLDLEPDMVYAGWESTFSTESAGERSTLADLGVMSYVSPSACKAPGYQPDPLTFDHVFADIVEAGEVFGAQGAAEALVEEQRAALADVSPHPGAPSALWYSSGSDVPYVGAGIGAPQMIMDAVGLTNIASGVRDTWTSFGWEQVVADDPDVIVLVDSAWNTAENKVEQLESNPVTAQLSAVREGRYLVVPFAATEAGVRNVEAAQDLSAQLSELELSP